MNAKIKTPQKRLEEFIFRLAPGKLMAFMAAYFRLKVEGWEHVPKSGAAIIAPNHSGFSGFDAMILAHQIRKMTEREPRILTHYLWFRSKATAVPAQKLGFVEATFENGIKYLQKKQMIVIFPEGEQGNFKPSTRAYDLQEFKRGFVRMAIQTQTPIIPTIIIGAEETSITLRKLRLGKLLPGFSLPLPLNLLPLPAKWKIVFLPPVILPYPSTSADDNELTHDLAEEIRERMQNALTHELKSRKSVYF